MGIELIVIISGLILVLIGVVIALIQNHLQDKKMGLLLKENDTRIANIQTLEERIGVIELDRVLHKVETEDLKAQIRSKSFDEMFM